MAFLRKGGNYILGTSMSNYMSQAISSSTPAPHIFQAIRFMSYSKLNIGGLSYATDNESLREAFGKYGDVIEVVSASYCT